MWFDGRPTRLNGWNYWNGPQFADVVAKTRRNTK